MRKTKVVIGQLGSPKTPKVSDVRKYLREFLGDPRVVDINPLLWKIILNLFVLPFRPKKSAEAYSRIWNEKDQSFPLVSITHDFVEGLKKEFKDEDDIEINAAFLLSEPRPIDVFSEWDKEPVHTRADNVLILPQFPQYSEATIASVYDALGKDLKKLVNIPTIKVIDHYHRAKCFIDNYVRLIKENLDSSIDDIVISFHGIPLRRVIQKQDVYYQQCYETFVLLKERIDHPKFHMTFQSRFGSEQWLGPATDEYCVELAEKGSKKILVVCPAFVVDCLETTDEIGTELAEEVKVAGAEVIQVPCLNADPQWVKDYAQWIRVNIRGSLEEKRALDYTVNEEKILDELPEQVQESPPLEKESKGILKTVFLAVFLDLVGFSIIFPLFPQLAQYYLEVDGDNYFLKLIWESVNWVTQSGGNINFRPVVLFGGILGALYSLLQFVAAPLWGSISDRIGRKPVMLFTITGLFLSYVMWIFAGSFTLLILARFIGGIMGGNLSTATAIVSDITDKKRRSKGMAFIGIAFAFGFIFGPAIGGLLSLIDLRNYFPNLEGYGLNPFSAPALLASVLAFINILMIKKSLPETLKKDTERAERSANLFKIFSPLSHKGVNQVNLGYFLFITAFAGMEFTLTFLAVERLSYQSVDNGFMFIFIGFVIAFVQGGYVRRKAHLIGEDKMAMRGLTLLIPGLATIAYAQSSFLLYVGLFFLATGSAMIIPCLTSLVSFYAPESEQGKAIGTFRSLGSLGRVIGPIIASLIYWKYGSTYPYLIGAIFLLIPILIIKKLPKLENE